MHFDLPDLRLFIHVAEAKSMTGGAKRAHLSTAAASTRIKSLEGQIGIRLFYRGSQGVDLTPAGEKLLNHARLIMRQVEFLKSDFSEYSNSDVGHIRIFANTTAVSEFLPDVLAKFLGKRPAITIDLQERSTNDIFRGILDGAADLGITSGEIEVKGLEVIPFSMDKLVLVVPKGHALANKNSVKFIETLSYPHIGLHDGSTLFQFLNNKVNEMGGYLPARIKVFSFEPACRMIESGAGIGVLPKSVAQRYENTTNVNLIELEEDWAKRERSVVVREIETLPDQCKALISAIKEHHL